jgi:hypothetical protein
MPARLPTAFESAIETVITDSITAINNKSTALPFVVTANSIKPNPTTWCLFTLAGKIRK